MNTTYIPMRRGFVYLTAVVNWATRRVLAFRVSISLAADAAVGPLKEAIARYGAPEIVNTDQGSQLGHSWSSQHHFDAQSVALQNRRCWLPLPELRIVGRDVAFYALLTRRAFSCVQKSVFSRYVNSQTILYVASIHQASRYRPLHRSTS